MQWRNAPRWGGGIFIGLIALGIPGPSQNVALGAFLLLVMILFDTPEWLRQFFECKNRKAKECMCHEVS